MEKTADLLARIGVKYGEKADGIVVFGNRTGASAPVDFDPAADHRMAMAAAVAGAFGAPIEIREREVVNKSFPEFWSQCAQL